jgi:hypothetical protein
MKGCSLATSLGAMALMTISARAQAPEARALRCEWTANPIGIDSPAPRLSWQMHSTRSGAMQAAYRILAASSRGRLDSDRGDLWDSGRVESDATLEVRYAGRPLQFSERVYWKVRIWDDKGLMSADSAVAFWEMGLLSPEDRKAAWIALPPAAERTPSALSLREVHWTSCQQPSSRAQNVVKLCLFKKQVDVPADQAMKLARMLVATNDRFWLRVNGEWLAAGREMTLVDLADDLRAGSNEIVFAVQSDEDAAAMSARLLVERDESATLVVSTDESWQTSEQTLSGLWSGIVDPS